MRPVWKSVGAFSTLAMDKRWLRAHVRGLRNRSVGQLAAPLAAAFAILTIVFAFVSAANG